jgi:cell division protein FtsX
MLVSSTSIKVASITVIAISHGLTLGIAMTSLKVAEAFADTLHPASIAVYTVSSKISKSTGEGSALVALNFFR